MTKKTLLARVGNLPIRDCAQILSVMVDLLEKQEDHENLKVIESLVDVTEAYNEKWGESK